MGQLIVAIMNKVESMKTGATLDQETAELIEEVLEKTLPLQMNQLSIFKISIY